jgi:hypothetical protein
MGMAERQRGAADPGDATAQDMKLLTWLHFRRVREKGVLDLWHLTIVAHRAWAGVAPKSVGNKKRGPVDRAPLQTR